MRTLCAAALAWVLCLANAWAEEESILVVSTDELASYWILEKTVAPKYPQKALNLREQGCVTVGFVIEPDGTTNQIRALAAYPSKVFNTEAIRAVNKFRFKAAETNPNQISVFTYQPMTFQISGDGVDETLNGEALADLCGQMADEVIAKLTGEDE